VTRIAPLLEGQEIDLASDRLVERRRTLPEREQLRACHARIETLDAAHAELVARREALARSEHGLADEVAEVASHAKTSEDTLYSGTVRASKELTALQEEIRLIRTRQTGLEEQEMALLEEIDALEHAMDENRAARAAAEAEETALRAAIADAEGEIDAELGALAGQRVERIAGLPEEIVATYERLRGKEKLGGRAAAPLADGGCGGCRVRLPVLEYNTMKAQPEDALLLCPRCGRVLVR